MISNLKNRAGRVLNVLLFPFLKPKSSPDELIVNNLPLPALLIFLIQNGKWNHPGDEKLRRLIPFLQDDLMFVDIKRMQSESEGQLEIADLPPLLPPERLRQVRGSKSPSPIELPWLDVEKMIFVAISREIGADIAIALDYRTSISDPRVIINQWQISDGNSLWREVTPTFTEFVECLGLLK